jgi:FkbM family methyltransferase
MTWTVAFTGDWDLCVIQFVQCYVEPQTLVLDIGASLGLWSVPLGRGARDRSSHLWAFEPDPRHVAWLTTNVQRNRLTDAIQVLPCALGSKAATARLGYREPGGGNAALRGEGAPESVDVNVARLDDFDLPRRVSFMKLDVEGFELEVLRGAQNVIERDRPVIFGEFSTGWLHERGEDLAEYLEALTVCGYDVFAVENHRSARWRARDVVSLRRVEPQAAAQTENLLLVPQMISA